ncbi:MAG: cation diffusion facilitator family transporter [Thermoleophilia bacterium]|nr:cation diffusion facilitator family transporter [Thermoleophilia bacterium]
MSSSDHDAHGHSHGHAHSHGGAPAAAHSHAPSSAALAGDSRARRALTFALVLGLVVLVAEVIAGLVFGSLALLGDAAHMATDVAAYGVALWAARVAARPASRTRTFGHGRVEILAALANGATLLAASTWILVESIRRLVDPSTVDGAGMSAVAALGLVANAVALFVLWRAGSDSLNMRGAMLHAAGDLLGSAAALAAGIVIATTGWQRADPLASLLLTALIVVGAWRLVRQSADVLLDAAPVGIDSERVAAAIVAVDGVIEAHDVHVWTMAPGTIAASAHVRADARSDGEVVLDQVERALRVDLAIQHTTIQLRVDRGSRPMETVPLMQLEDAVDWATDHIARANPDLSRAVIAAAAGAAAIGIGPDGRVSPVTLSSRTLQSLGRRPGGDRDDSSDPSDQA